MKNNIFSLKVFIKNDFGIILVAVLWILVILTSLAIGIGYRAKIEIELAKHALGKLRSKYVAQAGVVYSLGIILSNGGEDSKDKQCGTLYSCGVILEQDQAPEDIFREVKVSEGVFDIRYIIQDSQTTPRILYGFQDEERKVNINTLTPETYKVFSNLMTALGHDQEVADAMTASILDWKDANNEVYGGSLGAEDEYYSSQEHGYRCKNQPFDSLQELMLVKGMTPEIFESVRPYITIFPKSGRFVINSNTAAEPVLLAMARALSGPANNTEISDADSLVQKILSYRSGDDAIEGTKDDRPLDLGAMPLNAKERVIFLLFNTMTISKVKYLRAVVKGVDQRTRIPTFIDVVIDADQHFVVSWNKR